MGFGFNVKSTHSDRMTLFLLKWGVFSYNLRHPNPVKVWDKKLIGLVDPQNPTQKCYVWVNVAFKEKNPMKIYDNRKIYGEPSKTFAADPTRRESVDCGCRVLCPRF
jgi:hypothetical protein